MSNEIINLETDFAVATYNSPLTPAMKASVYNRDTPCHKEEEEDDEDEDENEEEEEEEDDDDEDEGDDEEEEDEEEEEEEVDDDDEDDDDDVDDDDVSYENEPNDTVAHDDSLSSADLSLNSERMIEVTRKLFRSTERDPDRDLRKQVLLRTAIRRLPHFMESACNHYSDTYDQNFRLHNNSLNESNSTTPSHYYENHNIYHLEPTQPKSYYHSVQPNAIQMSTTSLRMLDLNDDHDPETNANNNTTTTTTETTNFNIYTYSNHHHLHHHQEQQLQHQQLLQHEANDCHLLHHATNTTVYNDSIESTKLIEDSNVDECAPVLPANEFLDETTIASRLNDEDRTCLDGGSSSSQSSTSSEDSINSSTQSNDSAGDSNGTSILETSLNTSSEYHYMSHDSGVALFSPKSNKRTSSSIGLDDEMEIDHLSADHSDHMSHSNQVFTGSVANHCKRLRKREVD